MKSIKFGMITVMLLGINQISSGEALLIDAYSDNGGSDPADTSAWVNAGVTEDISDGAGGTSHGGNGNTYNIDNLVITIADWSDCYQGGVPDNGMLNDYHYVNSGTASVSLSGFDDGAGNAQVLTSSLTGMTGNTFTLEADQDYKLYLFGVGDSDGQDTAFTFNGVTKTTSTNVTGAAEDSHYVTYEFTTPADLTGYTLDFTYSNNSSAYAAWNGLALVMIGDTADAEAAAIEELVVGDSESSLSFSGTAETGYVLKMSSDITDTNSFSAVTPLSADPGTVDGNVITTDTNGEAAVVFTATGNSVEFYRVDLSE